jgi:hypothetical protein
MHPFHQYDMPVRQIRCGDLLAAGPAWRGYVASSWGPFPSCGLRRLCRAICEARGERREALIGEGSAAGERTQDTNRAEGVAQVHR